MDIPDELKHHIDEQGRLKEWPSPRSKKGLQRIALQYLASKFETGVFYTEKEVNAILRQFHTFEDPALLRRELYDKGYFDRELNGSKYWRTPPEETA